VAHETLAAFIDDPSRVSAPQRSAVVHPGRFFLTACPGSGKTRTVGVRLAFWAQTSDPLLGRPRRVAATSYTNTAVRQITTAAERAGQVVADPHFVGTLHRFLLRYVVRPFGRTLMGCAELPKVVGDTAGRSVDDEQVWIGRFKTPVPVWNFDWRADGTLTVSELPYALPGSLDLETAAERGQERALEAKAALAVRGLLSMSDVLYWAMRALQDDDIARVVASRFDELIVDEVQDTGDVQQQCIRRLHDGGIRSVVYVGDMQQAIYGFAYADPASLAELIRLTTDEILRLNENWRSSQAICDVTHQFSDRGQPDRAVGVNRDAGHAPELIVYPDDDEQQAVDTFTARLAELGISAADAIVLCRWMSTTERLRGTPEIKLGRGLRPLVEAAAAVQGRRTLDRTTLHEVERLVMGFVEIDADLDTMDPDEHLALRIGVMGLLGALPGFDLEARAWTKVARDLLKTLLDELCDDASSPSSRVKTPPGAANLTLAQICGGPDSEPPIQTIHSVKGASHLATLVIAVDSTYMPSTNSASWLGSGDPEEVRVAYVALTRAQRYSALALPASCSQATLDAYCARGFARI
jgi:hypothetical protein